MRTAVLSDIHGNWEALETAVSFMEGCRIDRKVVLGDTIGYGANPNECFEWAQQNAVFSLMGNHEKAVVEPTVREWFNPYALRAILWTAEILEEKFKSMIHELPYVRTEEKVTYVHGSLDEPEEFRYVTMLAEAMPGLSLMGTPLCFIGHTHVPSVFSDSPSLADHLEPGILRLEKASRYMLNPGSIGQPRDGDVRLSFGIYDDSEGTFELVRLPYDNKRAAEKIYQAGLPRFLGDRLL